MGEQVPTGVGKTALGVAMVRAQESRRSDRLFDDPYAAAFLAAAPQAFGRERQAAAGGAEGMAECGAAFFTHAAVRTRFFDDYLLDAAHQGLRQIVLLGAGLDTRAYRLGWPSDTRVFELDLPEVLTFKKRILAAHAETRPIDVDLRADWTSSVTAAGLEPTEKTAWLAEGLLAYLSADEVRHLLTRVGELSAPGSRIAFEHDNPGAKAIRSRIETMPAMSEYTALWKGGLPNAPDWLEQHGWEPRLDDRAAVAARYGRATDEPITGSYVTAVRT